MAMEISKTFVVNAPPEKVWSFLTDLPRVARSLPGAAIGEKLDDKSSAGTMTLKSDAPRCDVSRRLRTVEPAAVTLAAGDIVR